MFLLLPTIVINSAFIAQCDVWYIAFELGCVYYAIRSQPVKSMSCFGVAFAFKLQAVFLCPFLLILLLNKQLRWHHFLLIPFIYGLTCLPAWLEGRPWLDLATIYFHQAGEGDSLARHAPNLYSLAYLLPDSQRALSLIKGAGIVCAGALMAFFAFRNRARLRIGSQIEDYVFLALVSVALTPFFLPKMHDRYFIGADVFSLVFAALVPSRWFSPVCFQIISGLSLYKFHDMDYFLARHGYTMAIAIGLNVIVSLWLYKLAIGREPFNSHLLQRKDDSANRNQSATDGQFPAEFLAEKQHGDDDHQRDAKLVHWRNPARRA